MCKHCDYTVQVESGGKSRDSCENSSFLGDASLDLHPLVASSPTPLSDKIKKVRFIPSLISCKYSDFM